MDLTQWSTTVPFAAGAVSWCPPEDRERLSSYTVYETIYWNVPEAFAIVQRGSDSQPIYIPCARQIVETMQRYLAAGLNIVCDSAMGSTTDQKDSLAWFTAFARREAFFSKFSSNKRYGLIRGDWLFHITADATKPEGTRVSIESIDPAEFFPIYAEDEITVVGCHLVALMVDDKGNQEMYRQTYRKTPAGVTVEEAMFQVDAWGGPEMEEKRISIVRAVELLPAEVTALPIYHIRNIEEPGSIYGSSELRGIERLFTAINQSISDEELELALNGLGVYVTDAGSPISDTTGEPIPWDIGPAKVVEVPEGKTFVRVKGTDSVTPHQDHLKYLHQQLDNTMGMSAVAKGSADVNTAQSGIALMIELAPLFARADEKELIITDILTQMLWDLKSWFLAYEPAFIWDTVQWLPAYGERLPLDKDNRFKQLMTLASADPPIVSMAWIRKELRKLGFEITESDQKMMDDIAAERKNMASVVDPFGMQQQLALATGGVKPAIAAPAPTNGVKPPVPANA